VVAGTYPDVGVPGAGVGFEESRRLDAGAALEWCDLPLVAGTTVVNGTLEPILKVAGAKAVFYGISIAGVAELLGLERFCPRSR